MNTASTTTSTKKKLHYAWIILIGVALIVGLTKAGLTSIGGLFITPVTTDLGIGVGSFSLYFSIASLVTMFSLPIAGKLIAKYDVRVVLVSAIILQAGGFAAFGLMNSVWGWYIFCIPMSIGSVFITQLAGPILINNWFKKHNGLALGIMVATGGIIGAILQPAAGNLISDVGWRNTYFILAAIVAVVVIPLIIFLIRFTPASKGIQPLGADEVQVSQKEDEVAVAPSTAGVSFKNAKKSSAFIALFLFFFIITSIASFGQYLAPFAMSNGFDIKFAGTALGLMQLGIVAGALTFGFLSDKFGAKNTAIFAMILGVIPMILFIVAPTNSVVFIIGVVVFGFMTTSLGTLVPLLTSSLFGMKDYSQIYSLAAIGLAAAGIIALPVYGFIFQATGSYSSILYVIIALLIINILLVLWAFVGKKKLLANGAWEK
ncbi:MFS transporter [Kurthia sibirica]|uniref:MFS transporter n=1 Tax=Kurthia sibirica TaxID=202750 RepID=A0A2U3APB8_9BACL|nr:MFS transporter [Kurthia sibirica]PWI26400.1 MFS transporter [Kurthia sibirica]GEK34163.1 MFS transporter [Kurthia sibirica]